MLTPPALSDATISGFLRESYGLRIRQVTFLPLGADAYAAVYRVDAEDGTPYFLKLKRENFAEVAVAVPVFLHARGIQQVMAPLPTVTQRPWASGHGFEWILYPFFESHNAYEAALSDAQWVTLGRSLKAVHTTVLPPALDRLVPREDYSPRWRDIVEEYDQQVETHAYDDPIAESLVAFWITKRDEIRAMVARAAELGRALRQREVPFVLCHTDLHAWNVLVGAHDELAIVDWDETIFAPKERDLMFVGGGVGAVWDTAREEALFYQGYGATQIDPLALSYYRYERIVADLAAYGTQIFEVQGSAEDREVGVKNVKGQFLPNRVVAIAHRTYQQLPSSLAP
jgi:spectinomycin phosphotransferase